MHKIRTVVLVAVTLLCGLVLVNAVLAGTFSANYGVSWDARYGGGGLTKSTNYAINATVGQGIIGRTASDNYGIGAGYWYGPATGYDIYLPLVTKNHV